MATSKSSRRLNIIASILLFAITFALWQIYDLIMRYISPPIATIYLLFLSIPAISLGIYILFTKMTKSTLGKQGYKKPTSVKTSTSLILSIVFIMIYILLYLFPAFTTGNFRVQGISTDPLGIIFRIASAILFSLAVESIFRGYIFRNLARNHGFSISLYVSSILYALYQISIIDFIFVGVDNIVIYIFTSIMPYFAAGLFLGYFFYKSGWSLLGPAIFQIGLRFFLDPMPIVTPTSSPSWWMALTLEAISYVILIFIVDTIVKEPRRLRRQYGFEE